jgi:hypothetical protein
MALRAPAGGPLRETDRHASCCSETGSGPAAFRIARGTLPRWSIYRVGGSGSDLELWGHKHVNKPRALRRSTDDPIVISAATCLASSSADGEFGRPASALRSWSVGEESPLAGEPLECVVTLILEDKP